MSLSKISLSVAMMVGVGFFATGCGDQPEKAEAAQQNTVHASEGPSVAPPATENANAAETPANAGSTRKITGRVNIAAYALDNPVVVAQTEDGSTYAVSVAADGSFAFELPCEQTYRLFLANSVAPGSFRAKTVIQWNTEVGASIWARLGQGGEVSLGDIGPAEPTNCGWCGGYSYDYRSSYGYTANYDFSMNYDYSANFNYGANYDYSSNFGYSASYNYNYNYNFKYNADWRWGWQVGGSLSSSWGGSVSSALSGSIGGGYQVSMCLDYEAEVSSQISLSSGSLSAVYAAEMHVELNGGCKADTSEQTPTLRAGSGDACVVNADCNADSFCAGSVCRDVEY